MCNQPIYDNCLRYHQEIIILCSTKDKTKSQDYHKPSWHQITWKDTGQNTWLVGKAHVLPLVGVFLSGLCSRSQIHWCLCFPLLLVTAQLKGKETFNRWVQGLPGSDAPCPAGTRFPGWNLYKGHTKFKESVYSQGRPIFWNQVFIIPPSPGAVY